MAPDNTTIAFGGTTNLNAADGTPTYSYSVSSGYGAGVLSPAWYEVLFSQPRAEVLTHWMVQATRLLRGQDVDASSAHAIEGVRLAAGSDFPVDPERPLVGLHSAVTRQDLKHWPQGGWHPEQKMTLDEALRAYTAGAAYAAFEETTKGRIAPGFWADLTVISEDQRAIPPEAIPAARIASTIVGGTIDPEAR